MSDYTSICIVIPSLNPTDRLDKVIDGLIAVGFGCIIVVNDGSAAEHSERFEKIEQTEQCIVLKHDTNKGKGAALKTAFSYIAKECNGLCGVITVDSDGQHLIEDVVKCADALLYPQDIDGETLNSGQYVVTGKRDFTDSDAPRRNMLGNRITAFAFRVLFGLNIRDTQTGLRGIPSTLIPMMLDVPGNRFEFETNMLLELKLLDIPLLEVPIKTIYEEGSNERSNYRPFRDSVLIFSRVIKYAMSSIICFVTDISIFSLSLYFFGSRLGGWSIPCCTVLARAVSSFLNFNINRVFVFGRKGVFGKHIIRYYTLVFMLMSASATGLWLLSLPISAASPVGFITLLKVCLDAFLFFAGYYIQRSWVYKP